MINPNRRIIYFLYTVSGFTALTLEIVWARRFSMVFGNTTLAAAAVISATMAGLAFGAWRLGRLCSAFKSAHLLKAYGVLEAVIGLFAISMPLLIRTAEPVYSCVYPALQDRPIALSLIRFGLSLALLVIPATLMGGTFPLLARYMSASKSVFAQDSVNRLYSVNLLGAVAGAFAGGFILLPSMPVWVIEWFAAVLNWTVAIAAILLGRQQPVGDAGAASITFAPTHEQPSSADSPPTLIRSVAFAQGAAALTIQVLWMRLSGLVLGSSVYAFSAVLTTFLAGLWLGSALLTWPRLRRKWTDSQWLVISLLAGGWLTLFYLPVYERTFFYYVRYFEWCEASFSHTIAAQFFLSALPMLLPATLLGMIFPLILRIASGKTHSSAPVGGLYALNCLGGVAGAGFCALWLIPNVGLVRALKITALMLASLGGIFWLLQQRKNDPRIVITKFFLIGFAVIATALYPVDRYVLSSGVFLYADTWRSSVYRGFDKFKQALRRDRQITYYRDGDASTVTAMSYRSKNAAAEAPMSLLINGKTDASSDGDMATQLSMGYLPLLAHPEPKDVLIIGLGSGMTVAAVNEFETVRTVDVAEVEPRVVPACQLFARYNRDALRDKRVHVIFQDGRNHLQYTDRRYDVIISEPSNPWMAGVAQLYTRENYLRASKRLSEGGLYCQWLHSYRMSQRGFVSVLKTFASVFPHVYLFNVQDVDYLLLGSLEPLTFDMERARALIRRRPAVASDLAASGLRDESFIAGSFVLAGSDLRRALAGQPLSELNTDEKLSLGYEAAASMYLSDSEPIRQWLDEAPRSLEQPPMIGWRWPNPDDSSSAAKMDFVALQCEGALRGGRFADAMKLARRYERYNLSGAKQQMLIAKAYELGGDYPRALKEYSDLVRLQRQWASYGQAGLRRVKIKEKLLMDPARKKDVVGYNLVAELSFYMGDRTEAFAWLRKAIAVDPFYGKNYVDLARYSRSRTECLRTKEIVEKAQTYLNNPQSAHRIRGIMSEQARVRHSQQQLMFGRRYLLKHDYASANSLFEEAASIDPKNERAFYYLSLAQQALNATRESQVSLKTARSLAGLKKRIRSQVDRAALKELDKSG